LKITLDDLVRACKILEEKGVITVNRTDPKEEVLEDYSI